MNAIGQIGDAKLGKIGSEACIGATNSGPLPQMRHAGPIMQGRVPGSEASNVKIA